MTALILQPQLASRCPGEKDVSEEGVFPCFLPQPQETAPQGSTRPGEAAVLSAGCVDAGIGGFGGSCLSPRCLQQACPCLRRRQTGQPQRSLLDYHG